MDRVISCEFHFKQSMNRRANTDIFSSEDSKGKFKSFCRAMLEAQTVPKLMKEIEHLRTFLHAKSKREVLLKWLDWWVSRKEHIFRACKDKSSPESNLAEVIHSSWVSSRKTNIDLFDAAVDDITEFIRVKQMLRNYKEGSFGGCSGPSFDNLRKRKLARQDKVLNKVMDNDSDDEPVELSMNMVNISENEMMEAGCSPPRKKKRTRKNSNDNSTLKAASKTPRMPFFSWQESDDDAVCHIPNADDNKRKGNYHPRKSA